MSDLLNGLNDKQIEAVTTTDGPVMVIAGAGSGKTSVLTKRISYLINECGVQAWKILAVTFTNKATNEMKERVGQLVSYERANEVFISTFHSFCLNLLRRYINLIWDDNKFDVIATTVQTNYIKEVIDTLGYDKKQYVAKNIARSLRNIRIDIKENNQQDSKLVTIYEKYMALKKKRKVVDFDDIIIFALDILEKFPLVREYYHNRFDYIMIDEFQDTNDEQLLLSKYITNPHTNNIFIVGDQDQSIYAFRGANITNIDKFQTSHKDVKLIKLEENYRSTSNILGAANSVIKKNTDRIDKNLFSSKGEGDKIVFHQSFNAKDEANYVSNKIIQLKKEGYEYKDIGILYRSNFSSRSFEEVFNSKRIPYIITGGFEFFSRREIKDVLNYLKLVIDHDNNFAFLSVMNVPKRGIGAVTQTKIEDAAIASNLSIFEYVKSGNATASVRNKLGKLVGDIEELRKTLNETPINVFVENLIHVTEYKDMVLAEDKANNSSRYDNIQELKSVLVERFEKYSGTNYEVLSDILDDLALELNKEEEDVNSVNLMTIHRAKGLEYKVVFIVNLETGIFPSNSSINSEFELSEERRVFYVAVTRAKEKLFLTCADSRIQWGQPVNNPPSIFIRQIDQKYLTGKETKSSRYVKPTSVEDLVIEDYNTGDEVMHKVFGKGKVVTNSDNFVTIAFSVEHGVRKLKADHPSFKKID